MFILRVAIQAIMIKLMAKKLHLPSEVVSKAMEYQRLAAVRCSDLLKQYSDNCICVICLQFSCCSWQLVILWEFNLIK